MPQSNPEGEKATQLNSLLKRGSILDPKALSLAWELSRPIFVNFNLVLVTDLPPWMRNPQADETLEELEEIGTVIILAGRRQSWTSSQQILEGLRLWKPDRIILATKNVAPASIFEKQENIPHIWAVERGIMPQGTHSIPIRDFETPDTDPDQSGSTLALKDSPKIVRAYYNNLLR